MYEVKDKDVTVYRCIKYKIYTRVWLGVTEKRLMGSMPRINGTKNKEQKNRQKIKKKRIENHGSLNVENRE